MMDKNRSNVMQALWENNLKLHIEAVHEENKPFKCDRCCADFMKKCALNSHIEVIIKERNHSSVIFVIKSFLKK